MRSVAFDLDGTLITCQMRQSAVFQAVAQRFGIRPDIARFWALKRNGASTMAAAVTLGLPASLAERISKEWVRAVEDPYWLGLDRCFADTVPELKALAAGRFRRVLITARSRPWWLPMQLTRLRLGALVDEIIVVHPRRAAEDKAEALKRLAPIVYIGDTWSDAAAAREGGVPFVALDRGQSSGEFLSQQGVGPIARGLSDALRLGLLEDVRD